MTPTARRVTVVTPRARMDLALPMASTVAELLPQLIRLAGAQDLPTGAGPGWGLSRLGEAALAPGLTVAAAAVRDGEVLYLNPRERYETPLLFDDVVDAIASSATARSGAWQPQVGRILGLAAAAVLLGGAALLATAALAGNLFAPIVSGVLAVALLLIGGALTRAYTDLGAGSACAATGALPALLAGMSALPPRQPLPLRPESLALGLAALTLYAAITAVLLAHRLAWFGALAIAAALGALAAAAVLLFDLDPGHAAAVTLPLVTALGAAAPMIALRFARLPLPTVPADMKSFRADEKPALGPDVLGQTTAAEEILTGLLAAFGAVVLGCAVVLTRSDSMWPALLVGVTSLAWVLRSRTYAGTLQRIAVISTGLGGLGVLAVWLSWALPAPWLLATAAAVAVGGGVSISYAARVVRGKHSPQGARLLDALEYTLLISVVPLAGAVLGIYNAIRDAVG
ncbi:type VII secretion integral membrane protein EccD [Crossiella sp. CA-258035]|uniref:type VII secretion integral membrane protein EccD n=1 Tax=Crossiella sp. CA-258035 TaxID=2981138 RepID=UPI0024BD0A23|nr:type VII secretion integral membrane protein EccD [Crossiella sp. CA-258035]WHT15872.1 type VII secretion integral membrane protein EccD [Crossiella sp. CA-258035]